MQFSREAEAVLSERFGKDNVIALATVENDTPSVRSVNAYYESGAFYIITYALSNKMKQIERNSTVALADEWFSGHGKGTSLGFVGREENRALTEKLKRVFSTWIYNGHTNFNDENTIILRVELTDGVLFSHGTRYDL